MKRFLLLAAAVALFSALAMSASASNFGRMAFVHHNSPSHHHAN